MATHETLSIYNVQYILCLLHFYKIQTKKTLYSFTDVANASISDLDLTEKFAKLSTKKTNEKKDEIHSGIASSTVFTYFIHFLKGRVLHNYLAFQIHYNIMKGSSGEDIGRW